MMGLNAAYRDVPFDALLDAARETTDDEVVTLLRSQWRPRVMGAWLACGRARRLQPELLASLETAAGTLTAPALATVALDGLGETAVPALLSYLRCDRENSWGAASFIAAVLERLGVTPSTGVVVDDQDRSHVDGMLIVARGLAEGYRQ
jgi:hypothetical protein